jgi:hypothetical protein
VSLLQEHQPNDDAIFPSWEAGGFYDFGMPDDQEWFVESILGHEWIGPCSLRFRVQWMAGDITWEPPHHLEEVQHLDEYLELHGGKIYHAHDADHHSRGLLPHRRLSHYLNVLWM